MLITLLTPTNAIYNSIEFYSKLGFQQVAGTPLMFTDGKALVEIDQDRYTRAGIKIYGQVQPEVLETLNSLTSVTSIPGGYLLGDPSGVRIYLMDAEPDIQWAKEETSFSTLGNFAGLSLETTDFERSASIYEALGFSQSGGSTEAGYVSYALHGFVITLMKPLTCPHLFFNPSMTYFNGGKNLPVIEKIRSLGIPFTEEISFFNKEGIVDNIIIRDPGGYGFFIFND